MNDLYIQKILVIVGVLEDYMLFEEKFEEIGVDKTQLYWYKSIGEVTSNLYDLVICDFNFPETKRKETLAEIKLKLGETPIIALTSNAELNFYITLTQEGIQDVLVKESFDKVQLYKALRFSIDSQKLLKAEKHITKIPLKQSEDWFNLLFNENPTPKFLCRAEDYFILQTNLEATKLLKTTGHSIKYFFELFQDSEKEIFEKAIIDKKSKSGHSFETRIHAKGNSGIAILLQVTIQRFEIEKKPLLLFACLDITEFETTKNTLENYINRYQMMLKATNYAVWEYDLVSNKLSYDDNFSSLFGSNSEEYDDDTLAWKYRIHSDDREQIFKGFNDAIVSKEMTWQANYRYQKGDGSYTQVFDQCTFVRNEQREVMRAVGVIQDVTLQKERAHQLHLMEKVVESTNDPILITDVEPINTIDHRIIFVNDAFLKQTGYSREEIIGKSPRILQGPKSNRKELNRLKKAMENWQSCLIETINYKKDGTEFWVEFSVAPIADENGKFTNWISIHREITNRVKDIELKEVFQRISLAVSQPKDMAGRFEALLRVILGYTDLKIAEGWIMNIDNSKLNKVISCTQPFDFDDISEMKIFSQEAEIGKDLPGSAWEKGEIIIWEDLENQKKFVRNKSLLKYQLKTAIAIPIYHEKILVGVITLFSQKELIHLKPHFLFFNKISYRLGAELIRMKTEDELKTIFDLTPNLLFIIDFKGIIKKGNMQTAITLNCIVSDLIGKSFRTMIPEGFQSGFDNFLNNLGNERPIADIDIPLLINDQIKWINLTATLLPTGFFIYCVGKDISHQKNLEDLIYRANKIVRIGTWEINLAKNSVYWSPMVKVIHELDDHYEPDINTAINFYTEGYSRDLIQQKVALAIKGEIDNFNIDAQLVTSKGKTIWVRVQAESEWINGKLYRIYGSIQDINERKNAEEEIAETKIRYDLATKGAIIGIWDWTVKDNLLKWDDTMRALYGVELDSLTDNFQLWEDILHPDDREEQRKLVLKIMEGQNDYNTKFRIVLPKSGEIRFIKAIAYVVRNNAGDLERIVGINYDVTEEVKYKMELEKANHEIEDILRSITDGFFTVDKNWIVTYWNNAAEKMLKKPREKIVGKNLWDVYEDAKKLKFFTEFSNSMEKREERSFVEYYPTVGIWLECTAFPKENGIVIYMKNITSRILQQKKLAEIRLLQEHVINSTEDLIWAIDDEYKLILANNAFYDEMERLSGHRYSIGERVANYTEDNSTQFDEANRFWNNKYKKVLDGFQQNLTFESIINDVEPKTFQVGFYPILDKSSNKKKVIGASCFSRNITDKINHLKALEKQNKKLKDITWKQSHIVRAPVARIMGLVNLQKNMNYSGNDLNEILNYIMDSTEELDQIIRDISKRSNDQ